VRASLLLVVFACMGMVSTWSRAVYHPRVDAVYMLIIAALTLILGNLVHVGLTSLSVVSTLAREQCTAPPARSEDHFARHPSAHKGYTAHTILLRVLELPAAEGGRRLSMAYRSLWMVVHPFALGVFALFVVVPGYDMGCTVSFAAGLTSMALVEEMRRGAAWKRKLPRKVLLGAVAVLGMLLNALMFGLSYVALMHVEAMDEFEGATLADHLLSGNFTQVLCFFWFCCDFYPCRGYALSHWPRLNSPLTTLANHSLTTYLRLTSDKGASHHRCQCLSLDSRPSLQNRSRLTTTAAS